MNTTDNEKKPRYWIWLSLIALAFLIRIAISLFVVNVIRSDQHLSRAEARPLVLIHHPSKNAQFEVGEGVLVHTTARFEDGLSRLELWADDIMIAAIDKHDQPSSNLVLSQVWIPHIAGGHVIVARAYAQDDTQGQAAIQLRVHAPDDLLIADHIIQEGETLESIAEDYELEPEDLVALNPGIETADLAPGDALVLPDDEPTGQDPAAGPEGDGLPHGPEHTPPIAEVEPPAESPTSIEYQNLGFMELFRSDPGDLIGVQAELLILETGTAYERLYCYIGVGDQPPNRYPDLDGNAATDEWFFPDESTTEGGAYWQIEGLLEAENAPLAFWPQYQALPFNIACVGITGGGTQSARLGRWEGEIPPERWTGMPMELGASGVDGWFTVTLRLTRYGGTGRGIPLYTDPTMVSPTNARLDEERHSLRWDYIFPETEDQIADFGEGRYPIDGFRIYLNGNLLWVEPPNARESFLPHEWFHPPCGSTYSFAVSAYRHELPDGPESLPAVAILEQPFEGCHREIQITFLSLETFELDGDGRRPAHHGDVGPVYGYFYANDQQVFFDTRAPGRGGSLDRPNGLNRNSYYDLWALSADPSWNFSGPPTLVVEVPPGGTFEFGYDIMDQDYGRCRNPSDPGCDDVVCFGYSERYRYSSTHSYDVWLLDHHHEIDFVSDNRLCSVAIQWGPAFDSPVGSGMPGDEPLPWIQLEDLHVNEMNGAVQIDIRNTGPGTWARRDLKVELRTREGESLGIYTWPDFTLEASQRTVLENPDMRVGTPFDFCVLIDPFDDVLEEYERLEITYHRPGCMQEPDLVISDVTYNDAGGGQVRVTVENLGPGRLHNRTLTLRTQLLDGSPLYHLMGAWPNVSLAPHEARVFTLIGINESIREQMQNGYTMTINENGTIHEVDFENNLFTVSPYLIYFRNVHYCVPHYYGAGSSARVFLTIEAITGSHTRLVAESSHSSTLNRSETARGDTHFHCHINICCGSLFGNQIFTVMGDETMRISINAQFKGGIAGRWKNLGEIVINFTKHDFDNLPDYFYGWPTGMTLNEAQCVQNFGHGPGGMFSPPNWSAWICIAQFIPER